MPSKGQIIIDKLTGNTIEFIETAEDTNGKQVTVKICQKSAGQLVDDHIHVQQQETFKVLSGRITYFLNGEQKYLDAGSEITLPKNVPHNHYNTDKEPLVYLQTISPALDIDYFIENLGGLMDDGRVKEGRLSFLQAMVTLRYLNGETYLAKLPIPVQRFLANLLGPMARRMGYRALYRKYTGVEK